MSLQLIDLRYKIFLCQCQGSLHNINPISQVQYKSRVPLQEPLMKNSNKIGTLREFGLNTETLFF